MLVIVAACAVLFLLVEPLPPRINAGVPSAVGDVLAREALQRLKPGGRLTVITRDTAAFKHPETDILFQSFTRVIRKGGASITAVQALQVDPLRPVDVPPGDFFEWIRKSPPGSVIVSFMGPPLLTPDQMAQLNTVNPAILAFCPGSLAQRIDLRKLFAAHLLEVAVISRPMPRPLAAGAKGAEGWFDANYIKLTSANVANRDDDADASR